MADNSPSELALRRAWDVTCAEKHSHKKACPECTHLALRFEKFAKEVGGEPTLRRFACAICRVGDARYFRRYGTSTSFRCEADKDEHPYGAPGDIDERHKCQDCGTEWATQVYHGIELTAHCDACAPAQKITDEMRRG